MLDNGLMIERALARAKRSVKLIEHSKEYLRTSEELIRESQQACERAEAILLEVYKQTA